MELSDTDTYANFIYSLPQQYSKIQFFKATIFTTGLNIAKASGIIKFDGDIALEFVERIDLQAAEIYDYSYEIRREDFVIQYYDPQPHPEDPNLSSTFPHHKHVHPDIKHNRQPAPGISFDKPNLPFLIEEIIKGFF